MKFLRLIPFLLLTVHLAHAEPSSPFRGPIVKKTSKRARVSKVAIYDRKEATRIAPITFTARIRTEGTVVVSLTSKRAKHWDSTLVRDGREQREESSIALYQGTVRIRGEEFPAAASMYAKKIMLTFPGRQKGSEGKQRVYTLTLPEQLSGRGMARVSAVPQSVFHNKTCADVGFGHAGGHAHASAIKAVTKASMPVKTYRVLTISTEADPYLYAIHGDQTNAYIARIINTAEALFEAPLGIRFQIVKQTVYTDLSTYALSQTDPLQLLSAFATNPQNPSTLGVSALSFEQDVDVKHLFTGKDLDGPPVGLAYIGTICYAPKSAYGLTQATSTAGAPYYFAHEIGHNLGARHDLTTSGSVMNSKISIGSVFSQGSIDQIHEHLSYFGKCLETKTLTPNLANAKLTLKRTITSVGMKLRGRLVYTNNEPIPGADIVLSIGKRQVVVSTNAAGVYSYTLKKKGGKKPAAVMASTAGGETQSPLIGG
jgi:hypothetical protein